MRTTCLVDVATDAGPMHGEQCTQQGNGSSDYPINGCKDVDTDLTDSRLSVSRVPFSRSYWFSMFSSVEPGKAAFLEMLVSC